MVKHLNLSVFQLHSMDRQFSRVVQDTYFEAGYRISGQPVFKKPDPDIR